MPERIATRRIEDEMRESYLRYAMSVIVNRALPDARDGLKPSQRRILVAMNDLNLHPTSKHRKCAKITGDTAGNYHPHGEQVIYPTLVRMGQWWSLRYPLVDPQGNFGSNDGDSPAAQRYTEARFARTAGLILDDLKEATVPYIPNYEGTREEPTVLPCRFPNLLCNGSSGIAVGMSTELPPHNFTEVADALEALLDDPSISIETLLTHIKGPDFPTGGIIMGNAGIREAYHSGRGLITLRGRAEIQERPGKRDRQQIVITEMPYQVTRTQFREKVAELVIAGRIEGIEELRDLSTSKHPVHIILPLKRQANANITLNQLYKFTPLQTTVSIIMLALVPPHQDLDELELPDTREMPHSQPVLLTIKGLLEQFRDHRILVLRRRTNHRLKQARARLHIVEGLLKALDHIDAIIALIRGSETTDDARQSLLAEFGFTLIQANHILEMPLRRLTGLATKELLAEQTGLIERVADLEDILANRSRVIAIIKDEFAEMRTRFGDARRTEISLEGVGDLDKAKLIVDEEVVVTLTHRGYIKRTPLSTYKTQGRGGRGVLAGDMREDDFIEHFFTSSTHTILLVFTASGRLFWLRVWDIPEMSRVARGRAITNLLEIPPDDAIQAVYQVRDLKREGVFVVMATKNGFIKKTALTEYANIRTKGVIAIKLRDGDKLIGARLTGATEDIILGSKAGKAIRFNTTDVRPMGRSTQGVTGMRLRGSDEVVDLIVVTPGSDILTVCANGYGKRTPLVDPDSGENTYRLQTRAGLGVINIKTTERNGPVVALKDVRDGDELMLISEHGQVVRLEITPKTMRRMGRATQGVRLKRIDAKDRIVAVCRIPKDAAARGTKDTGDDDDDNATGGGAASRRKKPTDAPSAGGRASQPASDGDLLDALDADLERFDATHGKKVEDFERQGLAGSHRAPSIEHNPADSPEAEPDAPSDSKNPDSKNPADKEKPAGRSTKNKSKRKRSE